MRAKSRAIELGTEVTLVVGITPSINHNLYNSELWMLIAMVTCFGPLSAHQYRANKQTPVLTEDEW